MNASDIVKYCPNYNTITNFEFLESDSISNTLVKFYKQYVNQIDQNDIESIKKATEVDNIIMKYINDYIFRKEMKKGLLQIKVKKSVDNVLKVIIDNIIKIFERYQEFATRKIYISRWI